MSAATAASVQLRALEVVGALAVAAYAGLVAWSATHASYDVFGALVVIPVLVFANVPLLLRAARREPEKWFLRLLVCAFALKLLSAMARYAMAFAAYDGVADAGMYDDEGERLAEAYREGDFT
ncbi:MAG: hypothetical protein ACRDWY_08560, partial [Actinomycetes bacterium]